MPAVTLNGTSYNGTVVDARNNSGSVRIAPFDVAKKVTKFGTLLEAPNGALTIMQRGVKVEFTLGWRGVPEYTRAALETLANVGTSFTFINHDGNTYTVAVSFDTPYDEKLASTAPSAGGLVKWFDCTLQLRQV